MSAICSGDTRESSYEDNSWCEPYVDQARELCDGEGAGVVMAGDFLLCVALGTNSGRVLRLRGMGESTAMRAVRPGRIFSQGKVAT